MEEIEFVLEETKDLMNKAIQHTKSELLKIRAGKASPAMLEGLMVKYYDNDTPISQVASVSTPDARSIIIKPWEKNIIGDIERAIINSDLGFNPQNDGDIVRINIPPLTEERRINLTKQAKNEAEEGKISIRNARKDANDQLKKLQKEGVAEDDVKRAEDKVQSLTDDFVKKIDEILEQKEKEIMTV
ncbi:ribosome recycling factor [Marivirga sp. S37H4]|uniref:Ribosome-recycling factor n=1 Tax=Marivirga aurantiaca TaxID=2802615 RepID=A0A934X2Q8_9BACT|nr:ribosome recycling factor [Marivirga aurantiaca]MBK6267196.1 ribosome recycling factor [Marivirga aurantiaca]